MIPDKLEGWDLEAVRTILRLGITEDEQFDWKAMVPPAADDGGKLRVKEALAAFANGDGGFLVFGVRDDTRLDVEGRLAGVDRPDLELGRLNEYANACDPPVRWTPKVPHIGVAPGRSLLVVHVPRSDRRPHRIVDRDRSSFPVRAQGGTRQMTMTELRAQFADLSRRRRVLGFAVSEARRFAAHGNDINLAIQGQGRSMIERTIDWWMTRYDAEGLATVLPELAEIVDEQALEQVHLLVRDARASDRIAADFVAARQQAGLRNLAPPDELAKRLLMESAIRLMNTGRQVVERLRASLA